MKRILVVGRNGQVASELARTLPTLGEVLCAGRELADATQPAKVRALVQDFRPQLIINASAYTADDKAESEPEAAQALNVDAVALLAELAKGAGIPLIHYSTDCVGRQCGLGKSHSSRRLCLFHFSNGMGLRPIWCEFL